MKDIKTSLLAMLSVGLVGTWIYHLYDKTQYASQRKEVFIKDSIAVAEAVQDSLQQLYARSMQSLDRKLDSAQFGADSLRFTLETKMVEINRLRNEINSILKNRGASQSDMLMARQKISELQTLVDEMKGQKLSLEEEKLKLAETMSRLNGEINGLQDNVKKLGDENKSLSDKMNLASLFVASEIKLNPVTVKNDKEVETTQAKKTSKLVISFTVQNNMTDYDATDVFIIITQPDGKVLTPDVWESATPMTTHSGDRKNYTRKVRFEYSKSEAKQMTFSINADAYQVGAYSLQLYHKGYKIGQTNKTLY
jgi:predicted  nucleic acid-binding Zn-ribbon protein